MGVPQGGRPSAGTLERHSDPLYGFGDLWFIGWSRSQRADYPERDRLDLVRDEVEQAAVVGNRPVPSKGLTLTQNHIYFVDILWNQAYIRRCLKDVATVGWYFTDFEVFLAWQIVRRKKADVVSASSDFAEVRENEPGSSGSS